MESETCFGCLLDSSNINPHIDELSDEDEISENEDDEDEESTDEEATCSLDVEDETARYTHGKDIRASNPIRAQRTPYSPLAPLPSLDLDLTLPGKLKTDHASSPSSTKHLLSSSPPPLSLPSSPPAFSLLSCSPPRSKAITPSHITRKSPRPQHKANETTSNTGTAISSNCLPELGPLFVSNSPPSSCPLISPRHRPHVPVLDFEEKSISKDTALLRTSGQIKTRPQHSDKDLQYELELGYEQERSSTKQMAKDSPIEELHGSRGNAPAFQESTALASGSSPSHSRGRSFSRTRTSLSLQATSLRAYTTSPRNLASSFSPPISPVDSPRSPHSPHHASSLSSSHGSLLSTHSPSTSPPPSPPKVSNSLFKTIYASESDESENDIVPKKGNILSKSDRSDLVRSRTAVPDQGLKDTSAESDGNSSGNESPVPTKAHIYNTLDNHLINKIRNEKSESFKPRKSLFADEQTKKSKFRSFNTLPYSLSMDPFDQGSKYNSVNIKSHNSTNKSHPRPLTRANTDKWEEYLLKKTDNKGKPVIGVKSEGTMPSVREIDNPVITSNQLSKSQGQGVPISEQKHQQP